MRGLRRRRPRDPRCWAVRRLRRRSRRPRRASDAKAWILIDPRDDSVLARKAPNKRLPIASTTKLMTAYLALHDLKPNQMVDRAGVPARATSAEIDARPARGRADAGPRPALRRCFCRARATPPRPWRSASSGSVPAFVTDMNQDRAAARAHRHQLREPDRARRPRQLLERPRPGHPRLDPAAQPALRPDRRTRPTATLQQRRSPADGHQPEHAARAGALDQRRQDRPHPRRRLRPGRLRDAGLDHADLGGARHPERVRPRRRHARAPRLRLLALPPGAAGAARARSSPIPKLDYRSDHLPLVAQRAADRSPCARASVSPRASTRPDEVSGAVRRGQALGRVTVTVDGKRRRRQPAGGRARRGRRDHLRQGGIDRPESDSSACACGDRDTCRTAADVQRARVANGRRSRPRALGRNEQRSPRQRTPEERRRMHEERMRRRRQRMEREGGTG